MKDLALNGYSSKFIQQTSQPTETPNRLNNNPLRRAHTQRFQSADSGLDGCVQQKQSVIGSVGSSTSPDLPISYT